MSKTYYYKDTFVRADANPITAAEVGGAYSNIQGNVLQILSNEGYVTGATASSSWYKLAAATALGDFINVVRVKFSSVASSGQKAILSGRASTAINTGTLGYGAVGLGKAATSTTWVRKRSGGVTTDFTASSAFTLNADTYHWYGLTGNGSALNAYHWAIDTLPPTTASATASDAALTSGVPSWYFANDSGVAANVKLRNAATVDFAGAPSDVVGLTAVMAGANVALSWTRPAGAGEVTHKLFWAIGAPATTASTLMTGTATDLAGIQADGRFSASSWYDVVTTGISAFTHVSGGGALPGQTVYYLLVTYDLAGNASAGASANVTIPTSAPLAPASVAQTAAAATTATFTLRTQPTGTDGYDPYSHSGSNQVSGGYPPGAGWTRQTFATSATADTDYNVVVDVTGLIDQDITLETWGLTATDHSVSPIKANGLVITPPTIYATAATYVIVRIGSAHGGHMRVTLWSDSAATVPIAVYDPVVDGWTDWLFCPALSDPTNLANCIAVTGDFADGLANAFVRLAIPTATVSRWATAQHIYIPAALT